MNAPAICPRCFTSWSFATGNEPTVCPGCGADGHTPAEGASPAVLTPPGGQGATSTDPSASGLRTLSRPAPLPHPCPWWRPHKWTSVMDSMFGSRICRRCGKRQEFALFAGWVDR